MQERTDVKLAQVGNLLTLPEAAARMGISTNALRLRLRRAQRPVRRVGRVILVTDADLIAVDHRNMFTL